MTEFDDENELIKRIAWGDRKAFNHLYSLYLNDLYKYIYLFTKSKEDSEEISQNVFLKIWERKESLNTIYSFRAYIYKMAKNLLLDEIRRKQVSTKILDRLKPESEKSHEQSDARIIYNQYYQIVENAINLLPERRRLIVELRMKEDYTLDEIAEELSITKNVVKKQLYAGLGFIKAHLTKYKEYIGTLLLFHYFFNLIMYLIFIFFK